MAKTIIETEVKLTVSEAEKNTGSLREELRKLKSELAGGGLTGDAFDKAAKRTAELQDTIGDVSQRVKNLASDTRALDGFLSLTEGIVGGFTALQGITALLGDENEELNKTLVKLQGSIAALNGIQSVANALNKDSALAVTALGRAWSSLNNILKASIIGALVAIIAAVAYAISNLTREMSQAQIQAQQMADINVKVAESMAKEQAAAEQLIVLAKDETLSKRERLKAIKELNLISPEYLGNIRLETINTEGAQKAIDKYVESLQAKALAQAFLEKRAELAKKRIETETKNLSESLSATEVAAGSLINTFSGVNDAVEYGIKQATDNRKKELDSIDKEEKALLDLEKQYIETGKLKIETAKADKYYSDIAEKQREKEQKDREERLKKAEQMAKDGLAAYLAYQDYLNKNNMSAHDFELLQLQQAYERQKSELELYLIDTNALTETYNQQRLAINQKYANEEADAQEQNFQETLKMLDDAVSETLRKEKEALEQYNIIQSTKRQIANDTANSIMLAGDILLGQQFKQTATGKIIALAQIATDTALAISALVKNSQANPANAVTGGLAGVSQFASGLAQITSAIARAKAVLTSGGNIAGGFSNQPGSSSIGQPPPSTAFTGSQPQGNDRFKDIRVTVLEKDITDAQGRNKRIVSNSILE